MPPKDHYKTLGISSKASPDEIRKAFRKLAHEYHPDKNTNNPFSESHFREVHEAYTLLSDRRKRMLYDEERFFAGLSEDTNPVSSSSLLQHARQLANHTAKLGLHDMNHKALYEYLAFFLSDSHLAILKKENNAARETEILSALLEASKSLDFRYYERILPLFLFLAEGEGSSVERIRGVFKKKKWRKKMERLAPFAVLAAVLLLCCIMYYYAKA